MRVIPVIQSILICFSPTSLLRLTPSDARTVSAIMPDARSGATPLLIMALLRLVQAQEVPLIPGKNLFVFVGPSPHPQQ